MRIAVAGGTDAVGRGRIDVHQHYVPPAYRARLDERGLTAGGWPIPPWSTEAAIEAMDAVGTATGILSISAPGTHLGDDADGHRIAREVNEYGAALVERHPDRFGLFASLPLPDVAGAITELQYALDVLGADGVVLLTNHRGVYLGDPAFDPLWAELDARRAVVFIHPTAPPMAPLAAVPGPFVDFPFDTTRAAVQMVANGVMSRHVRMKVILSHAGGFLPYIAPRLGGLATLSPELTQREVHRDLQSFYFDTALSSGPSTMPGLLNFALPGRVVFGSDWPFVPTGPGTDLAGMLTGFQETHPAEGDPIDRTAAEVLFPRLVRSSRT
jgi:predicted TIM-barrel fold metal-dependent hydrolase